MSYAYRHTQQFVMPTKATAKPTHYDIYPTFPLEAGSIELGYAALARHLTQHSVIILDGYAGVMWEDFRERLSAALTQQGTRASWTNINQALKAFSDIETLVNPFLGNDDPVFGKRFTGSLQDFFDVKKLNLLQPNKAATLNIIYGSGATLANWQGYLVYLDVPKNEIQFRARAIVPTNLGLAEALASKAAYKRSYFVDWPVLNTHKTQLLPTLDLLVDTQRHETITFTSGDALRQGLGHMSQNYFRVRPWFEPGVWGGQWIKNNIPDLAQDVPNYAWSFELITPENGLVFESDGKRLEVSFDILMYQNYQNVLGEAAHIFKYEFPIRFDWLDTIEGDNLSVQCHPSDTYIRERFGETFTQDETYYILDCSNSANVYLGFQEGLDQDVFRQTLEHSFTHKKPVVIEDFVQMHDAKKHDLFLIPNGTIHCAGEGCMVLEISATPYIFTFKMYDWLRLDLDGKPRPLNIERAFDNLNFERQGQYVVEHLIAKPQLLTSGDDWRIIHLPTHPDHFYDVERLEFTSAIAQQTQHQCHVLAVVEGEGVLLETARGMKQHFAYAETFVIPAAAGSYTLTNIGQTEAKVIKAFVKTEAVKSKTRL
ncbi:MAG: class I mannose-6-phosphate isomerase [Trueperaceae bacterium]